MQTDIPTPFQDYVCIHSWLRGILARLHSFSLDNCISTKHTPVAEMWHWRWRYTAFCSSCPCNYSPSTVARSVRTWHTWRVSRQWKNTGRPWPGWCSLVWQRSYRWTPNSVTSPCLQPSPIYEPFSHWYGPQIHLFTMRGRSSHVITVPSDRHINYLFYHTTGLIPVHWHHRHWQLVNTDMFGGLSMGRLLI